MTSYHQINDQTYDFLTCPDLKIEFLSAGRKKLVFVEGYDDKVIFDIIYKDLLIDFEFIDISLEKAKQLNDKVLALGGCEAVKQTLLKCIENIPIRKCFGIIDRDLKTDEEIDIENYFIEPEILKELIRDCSVNNKKLISLNSLDQIEELILEKWQQFIIKTSSTENKHKYASAKAYFSYQFNLAIKSHCNVNLQINNNKPLLARILKYQPLHQDFKDLKLFLES